MTKTNNAADVSVTEKINGNDETAIRAALLTAIQKATAQPAPNTQSQVYVAIATADYPDVPEIGDAGVVQITKGPEVLGDQRIVDISSQIKLPELTGSAPDRVYALLKAA